MWFARIVAFPDQPKCLAKNVALHGAPLRTKIFWKSAKWSLFWTIPEGAAVD
jgi:hypothetical protein